MPARFFIRLSCCAVELETLFLCEHLETAVFTHRFDVLHFVDRLLDGLVVRQKAAEPAVVDVVLPAAFRLFLDRFLRLAFCADEKDLLVGTLGQRFRNVIESVAEKLLRFLKVNNINAVAFAKDVFLHLRVPTADLVTKVNSCFEEFFHRNCCQNVISPDLLVYVLAGSS